MYAHARAFGVASPWPVPHHTVVRSTLFASISRKKSSACSALPDRAHALIAVLYLPQAPREKMIGVGRAGRKEIGRPSTSAGARVQMCSGICGRRLPCCPSHPSTPSCWWRQAGIRVGELVAYEMVVGSSSLACSSSKIANAVFSSSSESAAAIAVLCVTTSLAMSRSRMR